ncbi:CotH kinase family protein [Haloferula chungangensis]|uniref:CotH kinase family protein n=1 Tax=Haloferula chungangensis TaxID=1048331 RepID=A0ABW2L2N2_9BACT
MKTLLLGAAVLCGVLHPACAELVVHWPLDASSGELAQDHSGNGIEGNWEGTGGVAEWQTAGGIDGGAVLFSGANKDSFITSSFDAIDDLPFTISVWVKTESSSNEAVVYLGNGNTSSDYYVIRVQDGIAKANARNGSEVSCSGTSRIDDGQWHHLVGVYTSSNSRRIYVDGVLEGSSSTRVDELQLNRFGIGGLTRNTPHNPVDLFTGEIDEVALWDRPFTTEDVHALSGITRLGAGNAGELDGLMTAFHAKGTVDLRGQTWAYASGLRGTAGETGGSVHAGNAFVVLDDRGNGMSMGGHHELQIESLSADHESIVAGVPVILSWRVFNAQEVSISGVGVVDSEAGSIELYPSTSTTYTLSASTGEETIMQALEVTVSAVAVNPRLSEFLARNDDGITDEDGDHSDWIEIHNHSAFAMNLEGYSLTDDPDSLAMWSFPSRILGVDERLIVWASSKDRKGDELHTNFAIAVGGEYLALVQPDGNTIVHEFAPAFPVQSADVSYSSEGFHAIPTPGAVNGPAVPDGILDGEVSFGVAGGLFFGGMVKVSLEHEDPLATIRYTVDGSMPDETSMVYEDPVVISATSRLKARAFRPGFLPGPVTQEGYIFADSELGGFDSDLPILVIDTFGSEIPRNDTTHREATFFALDPSGSTGRTELSDLPRVGGNSGIHVRGESSQLNGFNKLNFAMEVRDSAGEDRDVPLFGMPSGSDWALHASEIDRTFIRERLPHYLYNSIGRYSPRTRPVEVFLNQDGGALSPADYRGVYLVVERIRRSGDRVDIEKLDSDQNELPDLSGGYIFKQDKPDPGDVKVSTLESGSFAITYPNEEDVTPQQVAYLQDYLREFEAALNGPRFTDPELGYAAYIDVQSWVDFHVVQEFTKEVDSFRFSTFYYKDRNGKIACGPLWDFDRSFGNTNASGEDLPEGWHGGGLGERGEFWARLFEDPDFMQLYIDRWQELSESILNESFLFPVIDAMAAEVNEAKDRNFEPVGPWPLANVTRSHLVFPSYDEHVEYLKEWIGDRMRWVGSQFTRKPRFGRDPGVHREPLEVTLSTEAGTIYFTRDGSDPRAPGGEIAGELYRGPIAISSDIRIVARALNDGEWSGPLSGDYIFSEPAAAGNLVVSEIMYHPPQASGPEIAAGFADEEAFEFLEFMNTSASSIELANVVVSDGIDFTFGLFGLAPGERVVIARDRAAFEFRYGTGWPIAGEYGDRNLGNGGDRIVITASNGQLIQDITYHDEMPWPTDADGGGSSLLRINPSGLASYDEASNWKSGIPSPGGKGETVAFSGGDLVQYATTHYRGDGKTFSFGIRSTAEGVGYEVEASDDLNVWKSDASVVEYLGEWSGERHYQALGPAEARHFMRLRIREN